MDGGQGFIVNDKIGAGGLCVGGGLVLLMRSMVLDCVVKSRSKCVEALS